MELVTKVNTISLVAALRDMHNGTRRDARGNQYTKEQIEGK